MLLLLLKFGLYVDKLIDLVHKRENGQLLPELFYVRLKGESHNRCFLYYGMQSVVEVTAIAQSHKIDQKSLTLPTDLK